MSKCVQSIVKVVKKVCRLDGNGKVASEPLTTFFFI